MKAKKKRAVDPNAPPRPNLLSHDKEIRGMKTSNEAVMAELEQLRTQVKTLERKLRSQSDYLHALHQRMVVKK